MTFAMPVHALLYQMSYEATQVGAVNFWAHVFLWKDSVK